MTTTNEIKINTGYRITPVIEGNKPLLCYVTGRQGSFLSVLIVNGICTAEVFSRGAFGVDREFARVTTPWGFYNLSPVGEVSDVNEIAQVCDIIRSAPEVEL